MKIKLLIIFLTFCLKIETKQNNSKIKSLKIVEPKPQLVEIKNCITKEKLGYTKFFCTYYPDKFYLKINGKKLKAGESIIAKINEHLTIEYGYEWITPLEKKIGAKKAEFEVSAEAKTIEIAFSDWNNAQRIIASSCIQKTNELPIALETISFSNDDIYS